MAQSQLSFSSSLTSSLSVPSIILLTALLAMGLWMVKGTTVPVATEKQDSVVVTSVLPESTTAPESPMSSREAIDEAAQWAVANARDIPFPLYPNATRYRIGGENGLKLALFETTDEFGEVDHFYANEATTSGLSRQQIMPDYVQYGKGDIPQPASTGDRQGVLIYAFFDAKEARDAGATPNARTSIIISYR